MAEIGENGCFTFNCRSDVCFFHLSYSFFVETPMASGFLIYIYYMHNIAQTCYGLMTVW